MLIIQDSAGRAIKDDSPHSDCPWPGLLRGSDRLVGFVETALSRLAWDGVKEGGQAAWGAGRRMSHSVCGEQRTYLGEWWVKSPER